jgi:hypothetical protein
MENKPIGKEDQAKTDQNITCIAGNTIFIVHVKNIFFACILIKIISPFI